MENIAVIILIGIIGLLIVLFFVFVPVGLWISSLAANVKISIFNLIGMRLRRVVPSRIVLPADQGQKGGNEAWGQSAGGPIIWRAETWITW